MKTFNCRIAGMLTTSLLLTGVSALSPASVRAMNEKCSFGGYTIMNPSVPTCDGFIFDKQLDKTLKLSKLPSVGSGTIQFTQQTPGLVWVVEVDFEQDLMAVATGGTFEYELEIDESNNSYFDHVGLAIIGPPIGNPMFTATKSVSKVGTNVLNPPTALSVTEAQRSDFDDFDELDDVDEDDEFIRLTTGFRDSDRKYVSHIDSYKDINLLQAKNF
jgi:hypothetical protein